MRPRLPDRPTPVEAALVAFWAALAVALPLALLLSWMAFR